MVGSVGGHVKSTHSLVHVIHFLCIIGILNPKFHNVSPKLMENIMIICWDFWESLVAKHRQTFCRFFHRFSHMQVALKVAGIFDVCATSKALAISCLLLTGRPALRSSARYSATATSKAGYMPDLDEGIILLFEAPFVIFSISLPEPTNSLQAFCPI